MMTMLNGVPIIISEHMLDEKKVRRSWKDRLLSLPWRPWVNQRTVFTPSESMVRTPQGLVMHPQMWEQIKREVGELADQ